MRIISKGLRGYRRGLNLSIEYVAKQLKLPITTLTSIECGEREASDLEVKSLSEIYGVSVDEILQGEEQFEHDMLEDLSEKDRLEVISLLGFKDRLSKSIVQTKKGDVRYG